MDLKNMTLDEAVYAIQEGYKVKLPEWTGYWFSAEKGEDAKVLVMTKDGDVVDTPHYSLYVSRGDWQVTDGWMGFDFAIRAIKNGKKVARNEWGGYEWGGKNKFVFMRPSDVLPVSFLREQIKSLPESVKDHYRGYASGETYYASGGEIKVMFTSYLCLKTPDEVIMNGWMPSPVDLLADDWYVVI